MSDFLNKLNTLIRASIGSLTSSGGGETPRSVPLSPDSLGKDIEREITALRKRINNAIAHEDALQARLDDMHRQMAELDARADQALQAGADEEARILVGQRQRIRQRAEQQRQDLERHRTATHELMEQVNTLEAMVADAAAAKGIQPPEPPSAEQAAPSAPLSDLLRAARERVEQAIAPREKPDHSAPPATQTAPVAPSKPDSAVPPAAPKPTDPTDEDLAKRRARLSQ